jgi:hypothetical protein
MLIGLLLCACCAFVGRSLWQVNPHLSRLLPLSNRGLYNMILGRLNRRVQLVFASRYSKDMVTRVEATKVELSFDALPYTLRLYVLEHAG